MVVHAIHFVRLTASDLLHRHGTHPDDFELHLCVSGRGTFRCDASESTFATGLACLAGPGELHGVVVRNERAPIAFYYLQFNVDSSAAPLMHRLHERFRNEGSLQLPTYAPEYLSRLKEHAESGEAGQLCAGQMTLTLLHELAASPPTRQQQHPAVEKAIRLMREDLGTPLQLDLLAQRVSLERSYFIRLFKAEIGLPPMRYFSKLKIDTARYLLTTGGMSIADVAAELGFCDEYHFSRAFRRFVGMPPGQFREIGTKKITTALRSSSVNNRVLS